MPGSQADRLETLEDGDVLCGVGGFSHQKSPANRASCGQAEVYQNTGRSEPSGSREARGGRSRDQLAELARPRSRRRPRRPRSHVLAGDRGTASPPALRGGLGRRLGQRSGREAEARAARRRRAPRAGARGSSRRAGRARTPRSSERRATCSVPSRATRAGQAFARDRLADRGRPGPHDRGHAGAAVRREAAELAASSCAAEALHQRDATRAGRRPRAAARLERQRVGAGRGDDRLADAGDPLGERRGGGRRRAPRGRRRAAGAAGRRGGRRAARPRPAGARARRAAARPASRSCGARASPAQDRDVVEVRAEAGRRRARGRARAAPRAPPASRRLAVVVERRRRQPELVGTLGERPRRAARSPSRRAATSSAPSSATCAVHGSSASRVAKPAPTRRSAAFRWPTAAAYCGRQRRAAGRSRPSARSKYARRAAGPALHDREPVGREDERRDLRAQLLGRRAAARRSASPASARLRLQRDLELDRRGRRCRRRARPAPQPPPRRISCASARVRGEKPCVPTCSDSSRFVLPAPFGPMTSTSPGTSSSSSRA